MSLSIPGESTYTRGFDIKVLDSGFLFIPRLPSTLIINDVLYQRIFEIANGLLYPMYTVYPQSKLYLVPLDTADIAVKRGMFFPWAEGISERISVTLESITNEDALEIPIMKNYSLKLDEIVHIGIAGNSGSGKSYFLVYLLNMLNKVADLLVIDPKNDLPSRWSRENGVKYLVPDIRRSRNDFVSEISSNLNEFVNEIYERQQILIDYPDRKFKHRFIVVDEMLALTLGITKSIRDDFVSLVGQLALLGRGVGIHLILCSQRFEASSIPVAIREQLNILVQLGNITSTTTQFLFPDLMKSNSILVPIGKGTGIIQTINGRDNPYITPLLTPTYTN